MTTNNIDINIFIYSYKGKYLKDVIQQIINNSSKKHSIGIGIYDQHPLDRKDIFEKMGVGYKHLFWDWITNHSGLRASNAMWSKSNYFMLLSDNVMLSKDWDVKLIEACKPNQIISGNHQVAISAKNVFYIQKEKIETSEIVQTDFIDRDLIFGDKKTMSNLNYPSYIKYNGVEEVLSLDLFTRGIPVFAMPTDFYTLASKPTMETLYVPFSINHNYNEAITMLKTGINCCGSILGRDLTVDDFCKRHNFDFKSLEPLPFETNDVQYDPEKLNFNQIDARRYTATTKAVH